ncbi:hypothetical protein Tco_0228305 [Tanacetum coccineum]
MEEVEVVVVNGEGDVRRFSRVVIGDSDTVSLIEKKICINFIEGYDLWMEFLMCIWRSWLRKRSVGEGCSGELLHSLEMLTNSYLGGIMVNLIFLEGFEEEALVEFMVEFG